MLRPNRTMEGLIGEPCKIRKRGCSSSSSASSIVQNYRFKRAILVGKRGGSRSGTPASTWRAMIGSRSPSLAKRVPETPKNSQSQCGGKVKQAPVSARKLAATLWELNEMPSPKLKEGFDERKLKKEVRGRERIARSVQSGSLPPHLSDPSHSPVSERTDRSGTGSRRRRTSSMSQRLRVTDQNVAMLDSVSNASFMEIETRSLAQTPSGSTVGVRTRLRDVSNALTTSKELIKIISRMWSHEDHHPSSSMSLISALHAELERSRMQVNQLIQEERSDRSEINYLIKCFAEEKAAWKTRERETIEAAIESIAGELEVERKLRRRFESLNKKLGRELAETKELFVKAVKELESEKKARETMEQVYEELATDIGEQKLDTVQLKRESLKVHEEVESKRQLHQPIMRNEVFLKNKKEKEDDGEVEDGVDCEEDSGRSDLHSIELNMDNINKIYNWAYASGFAANDQRKFSHEEEIKGRRSTSGKIPRKSTPLQRSVSDGVEWRSENNTLPDPHGGELDWMRLTELEKQAERNGYVDDMQRYKSVKGLRDKILSASKMSSLKGFASPTRQWGQARPSRDLPDKLTMIEESSLKPRPPEARGEGQSLRRSKW